jgi:hypothetical protein
MIRINCPNTPGYQKKKKSIGHGLIVNEGTKKKKTMKQEKQPEKQEGLDCV